MYNGAKYIVDALESVLKQSYENIEIIVVDDGSTDETKEKLRAYAANGTILYIYKKNNGPGSARNVGIKKTSGRFIAFLDADDTWCDKEKLKKQVEFLRSNPDYGAVGSNAIIVKDNKIIDMSKKKLTNEDIISNILFRNEFIISSMVITREVTKSVGLYNENASIMAIADYEYWLRISRKYKVANIADYCVEYKNLKNSLGKKKIFKQKWNILLVILKNMKHYPLGQLAVLRAIIYMFTPRTLVCLKEKIMCKLNNRKF